MKTLDSTLSSVAHLALFFSLVYVCTDSMQCAHATAYFYLMFISLVSPTH